MNLKREAQEYSEGLSIPTNRLQFDEYHDAQQQADLLQVYFRDEYPPKEKYGFEIVKRSGSGVPDDITKDQLHRMMRKMEETYLENSGRVTFYKGQAFFWRELVHNSEQDFRNKAGTPKKRTVRFPDAGELYLKIECTSCGWELESPVVDAEDFETHRDIILMWLLARGKGRCNCDQFESVEGRRDENLDLEPEQLNLAEGERFPRAEP